MQSTFYTIYKTTNLVNKKIYIGKHITSDIEDGYMGSGKLLRYAIEKYGVENFQKDILFVYDNEADMNAKERELVTEEFVLQESNYNLCVGGKGGFSYINQKILIGDKRLKVNRKNIKKAQTKKSRNKVAETLRKMYECDERRQKISEAVKNSEKYQKAIQKRGPTFLGKSHTKETKKKMSQDKKGQSSGEKNSQYGTRWITNGSENKKIKKTDSIPDGWYAGRKIKPLKG